MIFFMSCEEDITPDPSLYKSQYVVEAYIEKSENALPPYLLLTRSIGFYSKIDSVVLKNLFVHGAKITIEYKGTSYPMQEICLSQLPEPLRSEVLKGLGINPDSLAIDYCAYTDLNGSIPLEVGELYHLEIVVGEDTLRSRCYIPLAVPFDSIWFGNLPGRQNDSFAQAFCIIQDNPQYKDFYRYFTAGMGESLQPNFSSVTNDFFFDGQRFKFTLNKASSPESGFSDTTGYFRRGDTVTVKWCTINDAQFDFWNTLEVSRTRQGPFSSYVRINGNIDNGLGIFGAQNCKTYRIFVPLK